MRNRCENQGDKDFPQYGGRGIYVCERWLKFENFHADMGAVPPGRTLDRIDNSGPYAPGNCRWATPAEQTANKRSSRTLTLNGRTMRLKEWAAASGIAYETIASRMRQGWSVERTLTERPQFRRRTCGTDKEA